MAGLQSSVFLIGPTGVGKTTLGARLASATGREFLDSDTVLCERTGVTVAETFELEGEEGFRRRECALIDELTQRKNLVLATGAGAVLDVENRRAFGARGLVIWMAASPQKQLANLRVRADHSRPLLQTDDPMAVLERMAADRTPLYRELGDHTVNMDELTLTAACDNIVQWLDRSRGW